MLIGRIDDPQNPCRVAAFEVSSPFGSGSRNPSGPAAATPRNKGRTHDRFRTRSDFFRVSPLHQGGRPHTALRGLMTVPPAGEDPAPHFAWLADRAARHGLAVVSMGMSADFETAIAHGATWVRVGSAIFGVRS